MFSERPEECIGWFIGWFVFVERPKNVLDGLCFQKGLKNVLDGLLDGLCLQKGLKNVLDGLCLQKGLKNVFDEAILAALEPPEPPKKKRCVIL